MTALDGRPGTGAGLTVHDSGTEVTVLDRTDEGGGTELLRYVYRPDTPGLESPKPYLHPMRTRSGRLVSLFRPWDHVWHKGLSWALPVVGEENFWGGPTYVHGKDYVQLDNNGAQLHRRFTGVGTTDGTAMIGHELDWITQGGSRMFTERRTLSVTLMSPTAWGLVYGTELTNVSGADLALGSPTTRGRDNAGYGGLFWRGPRSFTDGTLVTPSGTGGDELRGQRHPWMAFAGRHDEDDAQSLVLIADAADNPRHPPQWYARTEACGCLNTAPFFSQD
jgi:hypothetical protein